MKPEETKPGFKLQPCLKKIKCKMTSNCHFLNSDKTEFVLLGPQHLTERLD